MLEKIKSQIKEIATFAVEKAEEELGSNTGKEKKELAINFVLEHLPVSSFFKPIVAYLLSGMIDEAIEFAVSCMNLQREGS